MEDDPKFDKEATRYLLNDLKSDIKSFDDKWERQLVEYGSQKQAIIDLTDQINEISKIVHVGNGQPSLLQQMGGVQRLLLELKDLQREHNRRMNKKFDEVTEELALLKAHAGIKTPQEVQIQRWTAIGKIAGILALVTPGIISWLHM